jgi:hypothetical protein
MKPISYKRHRFPADVIRHAVWLYFRFTLSPRDVEALLAERGIEVSYEAIRCWAQKFGTLFARNLRRSRPKPTGRWHLDEMVARIGGRRMFVWRAVDNEGEVLDLLVQRRRHKRAAVRLLRKLLKNQGIHPEGRFLFQHGTVIRHALPPGTVSATSVSMQGATARARLIASASFSLMVAAGFLCAGSNAVDLAAVASSTDKNLRVAATAQKHPARHLVSACDGTCLIRRTPALCFYKFRQYSALRPPVLLLDRAGPRGDGIPQPAHRSSGRFWPGRVPL